MCGGKLGRNPVSGFIMTNYVCALTKAATKKLKRFVYEIIHNWLLQPFS